jgi:hypothetical protein
MALYIESDNLITVSDLTNVLTGATIENATITATLFDADGEAVTGAEDISVPWVASASKYAGEIPDTVELDEHEQYTLQVVIESGLTKLTMRVPVAARWRD